MAEQGADAAGAAVSIGLDALNRLAEEADDLGTGRLWVCCGSCVELAEGDPEAARARQRLRPFIRSALGSRPRKPPRRTWIRQFA